MTVKTLTYERNLPDTITACEAAMQRLGEIYGTLTFPASREYVELRMQAVHKQLVILEAAQDVYTPRILGEHVIRACYHCGTQYAKSVSSVEGQEYQDAAIIICMDCIERLGERVA